MAIGNPEDSSHQTQLRWHPDLRLPASRTMSSKFLLFISLPVCGTSLEQHEQTSSKKYLPAIPWPDTWCHSLVRLTHKVTIYDACELCSLSRDSMTLFLPPTRIPTPCWHSLTFSISSCYSVTHRIWPPGGTWLAASSEWPIISSNSPWPSQNVLTPHPHPILFLPVTPVLAQSPQLRTSGIIEMGHIF